MKQKCFGRTCIREKENWKMKIFMKLTNLNINKTYRGRKRENRRNHT